ncbi:MAG TPA: hypothetical protein VE987_01560 [Polyangiaceae bacterium]|nr:hypothetical protein [Polyangiaceae bacterium]
MLTVGETLRGEIERYAQALVRSNDLFLAAQNGALTADDVRLYVRGLLFLIQGTMRVLHRAAERASDAGRGALADHYLRKIREERGHDQWAERDLDSLPGAATASTQGEEQPALRDLLRYLDQVVDRDPSLLLSYILVAEYLTVLVGPAWLGALESRCGIQQRQVTVVANHVELDREHAIEGVREIDAMVGPDKRDAMLEVARSSLRHFERFWSDVVAASSKAA